MFPKDPETGQPNKIDGLAVSGLGNHTCIRVVSRSLGIVVSMAGSSLPQDTSASYQDIDGTEVKVTCDSNYTYTYTKIIENKEDKMDVKMIDIGQIKNPSAVTSKPKQVPEAPPTAQAAVSPEPALTAEQPQVVPVPDTTTEADVATTTPSEIPAAKNVEELLQDIVEMLTDALNLNKALLAAVKTTVKTHKSEVKELKSNVRESEELIKLRAAHKRLRAILESDLEVRYEDDDSSG